MSEKILNKEAAEDLVSSTSGIKLNADQYTELTTESALALSKFLGDVLELNSIEQLPQKVAKSIAEFSGSFLCLNGIKEISDEAIKELGNFRGEHLQLQGLSRANEKVINTLCLINQRQTHTHYNPTIRLPELNPSDKLIEVLFSYQWDRIEIGLIEINSANIEYLRNFEFQLGLPKLNKINLSEDYGVIYYEEWTVNTNGISSIEEYNSKIT